DGARNHAWTVGLPRREKREETDLSRSERYLVDRSRFIRFARCHSGHVVPDIFPLRSLGNGRSKSESTWFRFTSRPIKAFSPAPRNARICSDGISFGRHNLDGRRSSLDAVGKRPGGNERKR